jgi:hypothetical protein
MKPLILCLLFCLSLCAAETNDIQVLTTTNKILRSGTSPDMLAIHEVFTRGGQTDLIRDTHMLNGVVKFRSQAFYHDGASLGSYLYNGAEFTIGTTPGAPYSLIFRLNSSNQPLSAIVGTLRTNAGTPPSIAVVTLDSFGCSNGVFFPRDASWIRDMNHLPNQFPLR